MAEPRRAIGQVASVRFEFSQPTTVRPRDVASLLMDLETLYLLASGQELSPTALAGPSWYPAEPYYGPEQITLKRLKFGSPLQTLLEIPWHTWANVGAFFVGGVSAVYGLPKAAANFEAARAEFWKNRLRADKGKEAFIEWRRETAERRGVRLLDAEIPPILGSGDPDQDRS